MGSSLAITLFFFSTFSVEKLTEIARYHIETATKIQNELYLDQDGFFINGDIKVFPDPPPPVRPPPVEREENGTLTIEQLDTLRDQFSDIAPKGKKDNGYEKSTKKVRIRQDGKHLPTSKISPLAFHGPKMSPGFVVVHLLFASYNIDLNLTNGRKAVTNALAVWWSSFLAGELVNLSSAPFSNWETASCVLLL